MRRSRIVLLCIVGFFAVASLFSRPAKSDKAGQPILSGAQIDPGVLAIIERSCQDCPSEATHYPWYSYVAPVAWLIEWDVSGGRKHMNLSQWQDYTPQRRERLLSEIGNQVKDRGMPLPQYLLIHRNTRLSDADANAILQWSQTESARLGSELPR